MALTPRGDAPSKVHQRLPDPPPTVAEKLDALAEQLVEIRSMLEVLAYPARVITGPGPRDRAELDRLRADLEATHPGYVAFDQMIDDAQRAEILNRDDPTR